MTTWQDQNPPPDPTALTELVVRDLAGDNEKLQALFRYLEHEVNKDAPKTARKRTSHIVSLLVAPLSGAWSKAAKGVRWIADRLLDFEQRRAKADEIAANAEAKRATARVIEAVGMANADKTLAEAERVRAETRIRLLQQLKEAGLDWQAVFSEDGQLKIAVSRERRADEDFDSRKPR